MLQTDFGAGVQVVIDDYLRSIHAHTAALPIVGPGPTGAFPAAGYGALFRGETFIVVADTNILLRDLGRACRREHRTILVNAANAGALRLFCAEHVVEEMYDHIRREAASMRLMAQTLLDWWETEYLPLLRVVPDNALDQTILTEAERRRVTHLLASKDVPSVILAMALGAFYLTEDRPARWAVYDERASSQELLNWLAPLKDGGSADQLGGAALIMLALPTAAAMNLAELGKWLAESVPWLFWPLAAVGLGATLARTSRAGLRSAVTGVGVGLQVLAGCSKLYVEMITRFRAMAPTTPTWAQLRAETGRRKVLLRACLWTLSRRPESNASAVELADRLPILGVGQNASFVREVLRDSACFSQPHKGRWQVGHAV